MVSRYERRLEQVLNLENLEEAKKAATSAMSRGRPNCPRGIWETKASFTYTPQMGTDFWINTNLVWDDISHGSFDEALKSLVRIACKNYNS